MNKFSLKYVILYIFFIISGCEIILVRQFVAVKIVIAYVNIIGCVPFVTMKAVRINIVDPSN